MHGCRNIPYAFSFNTQPPEGGCQSVLFAHLHFHQFQHTAARRRLPYKPKTVIVPDVVSTHSRPKAAALDVVNVISNLLGVSTHSRPKAAA